MTRDDRINVRLGGIYGELVKMMECFQNIMGIISEIENIIKDEKVSILEEGGKIEDRVN